MTDRTASVVWRGDLKGGSGQIGPAPSGAFGPLDVTWASRAEEPEGKTSPEELVASGWAACFAMALANVLAKAGTPPEQLETSATLTFQPGEGIIRAALTVRGTVAGVDEATFQSAAGEAKENCPVSKALTGIPEVTLQATLA